MTTMLDDTLSGVVVAVGVIVSTAYGAGWLLKRIRYIKTIEKLPGPDLYGSWLCHVTRFTATMNTVPGIPGIPRSIEVFQDFHEEFGKHGIFRLWIYHPYRVPFARCSVLLSDPHLIRQFLTDKSVTNCLVKERRSYRYVQPVVGNSFLALPDGATWKHQRRLVARGFNQDFLEYTNDVALTLLYEKVFVLLDKQLENSLSETNSNRVVTMDMLEWCTRFASEVLGLVAFSYGFGSFDDSDVRNESTTLYEVYHSILWTCTRRMRALPLVASLRWKENRTFDNKCKILNSVVDRIIKERVEEHNNKKSGMDVNKKHRDLLSYMLKEDEEDPSNCPLSLDQLRGNIKMFMFAGQDTTATSLAFALWHLAINHEAQEKVRAEVDSLFEALPDGRRHPTYKEIMPLKYLDSVVRETLRMYTPIIVARTTTEKCTLVNKDGEKYVIPDNTSVFVFLSLIQRQGMLYPDRPNEWIPDRFLDEQTKNQNQEGWIPFSVGPRNCVGQPLAMAELKIFLAHVVRNYTLRRSPNMKEDPIPIFLITIKPHEVSLEIRPRTER